MNKKKLQRGLFNLLITFIIALVTSLLTQVLMGSNIDWLVSIITSLIIMVLLVTLDALRINRLFKSKAKKGVK